MAMACASSLPCFILALTSLLNISLFLQGCEDPEAEISKSTIDALSDADKDLLEKEAEEEARDAATLSTEAPDVEDMETLLSGRHQWTEKSRASPATSHDLIFAVKVRSERQLEHALLDRSDPLSPNYGKWLTAQEANLLLFNTEAVRAVHDALEAAGAAVVKTTSGGELVRARASIEFWEEFLQCEFNVYESHHQNIRTMKPMTHTAAKNYTIPSHISDYVEGILRAVELPDFQNGDVLSFGAESSNQNNFRAITPNVLRHRYKMPSFAPNGSLAAMISQNTSQAVFASLGQHWSPMDLEQFQSKFGLPKRNVTELDSDHDMKSDKFCKLHPHQCHEANLDVQWMNAMSPWSQMGFYYVDTNRTFADFLEDLIDMSKPPDVVSISYAQLEISVKIHPAWRTVFNNAAIKLGVQGVTVIAASGDDGAQNFGARRWTCAKIHHYSERIGSMVSWPASSPYVTGVGATMGVEIGTVEKACQIQCHKIRQRCFRTGRGGPSITSGGGYSSFSKPSYQSGHVQREGRGVPDVSLAGHAYAVVTGGKFWLVDGTSASAPAFGGMVSLVNAKRLASGLPKVGFINPAMYQHASAFSDIVEGDNECGTFNRAGLAKCCGGYTAGPGWDAVTGLGSVDFPKFEAIFVRPNAATNVTVATSRDASDRRIERPSVVGIVV